MKELIKYKHYLIFIVVILGATYITDPLWLLYQEQKETLALSKKRTEKALALVANRDELEAKFSQLNQESSKANALLFSQVSEGEYKLAVQNTLEEILSNAGCTLNVVDWEEAAQVSAYVQSKSIKVDFSGSPLCLAKTVRLIESNTPALRIERYAYGARGWYGKFSERLEAELTVKSWRKVQGK
ncbi:hypothetical protein [Pseudoalteromonas sp. PS5]|uniref:hypothetical protein n=1 Tax=Pseudoalteromonas sp. PS5 TaxID=1437473 RepID=UPI000FFF2D9C|nr:hypothetical protein [Pseudoalteromonas sp. PS5]RXF02887.1 hypothetical protein D9603_09325 [Pseudoalteromonas sp. PS5]